METFEPVNSELKTVLLEMLKSYDAYLVWRSVDYIASELAHKYDHAEVIRWLADKPAQSPPEHSNVDDRSLSAMFLQRLMNTDFGAPRPRLSNGTGKPDTGKIITMLASLPFESAINTWLAVCHEWLQICNADQFIEYMTKSGKRIEPHENIAQLMIGVSEYSIR